MTRGRKPKPTHLKLIEGNPGKRPIRMGPERPATAMPEPPDHLNDDARTEWDRVAHGALGYDPIVFGVIVVKMCEVSLVTPPIGLNCFVVSSVRRDIPLQRVFQGALPFVIADSVQIGLFLAFPQIIRNRCVGPT
jgi:hypothetical protein